SANTATGASGATRITPTMVPRTRLIAIESRESLSVSSRPCHKRSIGYGLRVPSRSDPISDSELVTQYSEPLRGLRLHLVDVLPGDWRRVLRDRHAGRLGEVLVVDLLPLARGLDLPDRVVDRGQELGVVLRHTAGIGLDRELPAHELVLVG